VIAPVPSQGIVETPAPVAATEPVSSAPAAAQSNGADAHREPALERRHPLRFVWQMDADGRFVVGSDEFAELTGPRTTAAFGRLWSDVAADLKLDPDDQVARALATRETWSGITVSWPVDDAGERLPVEMSGLPVFDRERKFCGYRGFGVCRDIGRINQLLRARREQPNGFMTGPEFSPQGGISAVAAAFRSVDTSGDRRPQPDTRFDGNEPPSGGTSETGTNEAAHVPRPSAEQTVPSAPTTPVAAPANVVPFRSGSATELKPPSLSPVEHKAFRQLAQELTARLGGVRETSDQETGEGEAAAAAGVAGNASAAADVAGDAPAASGVESAPARPGFEGALLDRLPIGVLIYHQERLLYANRYFLELGGYPDVEALAAAGGLTALFAPAGAGALVQADGAQSLSVMTRSGDCRPVEGRLFAVPWGGTSALALVLLNGAAEERRRAAASSLASAEDEIRQLRAKLDTRTVAEEELRTATREAQKAAAAKADFLGKVSHEIRTPLNAITGFTELILAERFGPIGNDRYRDYLKDVHAAGLHLVSLLNDLLDLSRIETGQLDLNFASISLNDLTRQCVGIMQPQASRARIIIRTALAPALPQVVADERSLRQIVLNLLSNSIRFTGPGGQVIVSTAFADNGEAVLRVRDTGVGMSEKDVEAALEPFRQTATSGSWGSGGTGLGLPLTKALAEANQAHFSITSAPNAGTLIEVAFPPARVVAQ
jgi:signal transduction histidine kinase